MAACGTASGRTHQAFGAKADEVGPTRFGQRLADQVGVLGTVVLEQGALELLLVVIGDHVNRLHVQRVDPRVEHDS